MCSFNLTLNLTLNLTKFNKSRFYALKGASECYIIVLATGIDSKTSTHFIYYNYKNV